MEIKMKYNPNVLMYNHTKTFLCFFGGEWYEESKVAEELWVLFMQERNKMKTRITWPEVIYL